MQKIERLVDNKERVVHYSPHRPVSPSLNDCLDKGLNRIEMIPPILHRFQKFSFCVVSNIEKAFL